MKGLLEEIQDIPAKARECLNTNKDLVLPRNVPYIGMGSSYYASLTLYYCGAAILPQIASEYYYYLAPNVQKIGVLISQSGESSETVWNLEKFQEVISVTSNPESALGTAPNVTKVVKLSSDPEQYSSTKSYVNTLITLYLGLGIDPSLAVGALETRFDDLKDAAKNQAAQIVDYIQGRSAKGLYVVGSGPNHGTALEAALTLSETTKLTWVGMPVAQYDHGPKETADDTVVLLLNAHGKDAKRITALKETLISNSNALVVEFDENLPEILSPILLIAKLNWTMNFLADEMKVGDTFRLGGKVTTVSEEAK